MKLLLVLGLSGCWNANTGGDDVLVAPTNIAQTLVANGGSTCVHRESGWRCWGVNDASQLTELSGYDPRPKLTPERIDPSGPLTLGAHHACSIAGGTLQCWGSNWSGQLGRVTDAPSVNAENNPPQAVTGLPSNAIAASAGGRHTCAILDDQSLWCWGDNAHGQLGVDAIGGPTPRHVLDGVTGVALGDAHTCAFLADHTVWCWGANAHGQLGLTGADTHTPTKLDGVNATQLALGTEHTCALGAAGITCWGRGDRGQLGNATTTDSAIPTAAILADATSVIASGDHTCAIRGDGSGTCWGANDDGELGDGTLVERDAPAAIAFARPLREIALGAHHGCAIRTDDAIACWGRDTTGELGDGGHVPFGLQATALPDGASALAVGAAHACAIVGADHRVYCWGDDHHGQLGDGGAMLASATPVDTAVVGAIAIAAGVSHTCAALADHSLWCWGNDVDGELAPSPPHAVASVQGATAVAAGDHFTCALDASGAATCFGRNDLGQLGSSLPAFTSISASYDHACGVTGGHAYCWGSNAHGEIGNGGVGASATGGPTDGFAAVATGGGHTCAISTDGLGAQCWGANGLDQLGTFNLNDAHAPQRVSVSDGTYQLTVGAGRNHTCVSGSGAYPFIQCFGGSSAGEDGNSNRRVSVPMIEAGQGFATALGGGDEFSCALIGSSVSCWGDNASGQLGIGTFSRSTSALQLVL